MSEIPNLKKNTERQDKLNKRVLSILTIIAITAVLGISYIYLYTKPQVMKESFENDFGGWVADADVPPDPNNPGHTVEWSITRATTTAHSGQYSLRFFIDGRQDDGTIWIEQKITTRRNTQVQIQVSFELYSERESYNTIAGVCVYIGVRNPETEIDFTVLGTANQVAGWKKYTYTTTIETDSTGEIWIAAGITVRWETTMTYFIDDIEVEIK